MNNRKKWPFYDYEINLIVLGDKNVGKTTFLQNFLKNNNEKIIPTVGLDFYKTYINTNKGIVKCSISDSSGAEEYYSLAQSYFRSSNGILFFYDKSNNQSLLNIEKWITNFEKETQNCILYEENNYPQFDYILIENKQDLYDDIDEKFRENILKKYKFDLFKCSYIDNLNHFNLPILYLIKKILINPNQNIKPFDKDIDEDEFILLNLKDYEILINKENCSC